MERGGIPLAVNQHRRETNPMQKTARTSLTGLPERQTGLSGPLALASAATTSSNRGRGVLTGLIEFDPLALRRAIKPLEDLPKFTAPSS